ncbi:MAG: ribosome maturation factor RimM [Hyphomicrobiaceae bacterium]
MRERIAMAPNSTQRILLGRIGGAHGLKGAVRIACYTDTPEAIAAYGPLADETGTRTFALQIVRVMAKGAIARISGVDDRTAAEALKGTSLYIARERLPAAQATEFYHVDLIGLAAVTPAGEVVGEVVSVQNYGAGDLIEIRRPDAARTDLVPFTDAFVPHVDLEERRIVVAMPQP